MYKENDECERDKRGVTIEKTWLIGRAYLISMIIINPCNITYIETTPKLRSFYMKQNLKIQDFKELMAYIPLTSVCPLACEMWQWSFGEN